ncbi:hypothetical protein [Embleya hyalina]|uniref:Uncharacterized protein n=1 Tax=Embleya hyalina TaxID=516124 RepID=A0A401YT87_9ACTN|nr:hypothetical protein [Embleya hyalina]GCD97804.1 hypothetical protein EHYA_05500 [Embleya hyalina]
MSAYLVESWGSDGADPAGFLMLSAVGIVLLGVGIWFLRDREGAARFFAENSADVASRSPEERLVSARATMKVIGPGFLVLGSLLLIGGTVAAFT